MLKKQHFTVLANLLPATDPRYQRWLKSLRKRPPPWNKGETKYINSSVRKISKTFKSKRIDNFRKWRNKMIEEGKIKTFYPPFQKTNNLAILTGLILGDGHIDKFPRTEKLTITFGTDKPKLIEFTAGLVGKIFDKKPRIYKERTRNAMRISLYQKNISKRLKIPSGNRRYTTRGIPKWIWNSRKFVIGCLRGLFEAEASLSIHLPTYTYNFAFTNRNEKLLEDVYQALVLLGLHPEVRLDEIRLRRRIEVQYFKTLISFRKYTMRDRLMVDRRSLEPKI